MLLDIGMVRSALESDIQSDFQPMLFRCGDELPEIRHAPELGMDRLVSALFTPDGPRASRIIGVWREDVVLSLAKLPSDWMDRRQVKDIKSHGRNVGEPFDAVFESTVLPGSGRAGARKHFVPRAEARLAPIHRDREFFLVGGRPLRLGILLHDRRQLFVQSGLGAVRLLRAKRGVELLQALLVGPRGALGGMRDELRADQEIDGHVLAGLDLFCQAMMPRFEAIDPGLQSILILADLRDFEGAAPAVIDEGLHPGSLPAGLSLFAIQKDRRDRVMAVGENIGLDDHSLAHDPFRREAPAVDLRFNALDDDSFSPVIGFFHVV